MISVANKRFYKPCDDVVDAYIGRPSPLGNPFASKESRIEGVTRVDSAEEAVEHFRKWLWEKIKQCDADVMAELRRLLKLSEQKPLVLICWCVDASGNGACHGRVIAKALEWLRNSGIQ